MQQTYTQASPMTIVPQETKPRGPRDARGPQPDALPEVVLALVVGGGDGGPTGAGDRNG